MASGIHTNQGTSATGALPEEIETEAPQRTLLDEKVSKVNIQTRLLGTALASIRSNSIVMERYATKIESHADNVNKTTNLLTRLDDDSEESLTIPANDQAYQKQVIEVISKIAKATDVEIPPSLKQFIESYKAAGDQPRIMTLNKDQLGRLKSLCKSISDRVGKLETQDQMRLNQAQSDHANTIKWIINILNSYQSMIDKILQMGERR